MDAYDALNELNFILTIFTLHNIYRGTELVLAKWPFLKMFFILFCFALMLTYNLYFHYFSETLFDINGTVKVMDTISIIFGYLQYLIDLYFVYKYAGQSFIVYYETYDEVDKCFEMKYHREIRQKVKLSMGIFLVLWFFSSGADYVSWCSSFDWQSPTTYIVVYFTFLIRILTVLELNSHSMLIGYRLKTIADVLRDHFTLAADMPSRIKVVKKWPPVLIKNKAKIVPVKIREANEIGRLGSYYLLLSQQATFLNNFFGVRTMEHLIVMLRQFWLYSLATSLVTLTCVLFGLCSHIMHCLYTLSEIISFVNLITRVLVGSMYTRYNIGYYPAVTTSLRLVTCAALLTSLVYRCEQSSRQSGHVITALDHLLINKKTSMEDHTSLQQLRGLVSTRPIRFHAANFFNLDSTLILSMASVVATYAVILIQTA